MSSNFVDSVDGWTADLKAGASAADVIASMTSVVAERLVELIYEYDPDTADLDAILEESEDHKRNPMAELGEELSIILNHGDDWTLIGALETMTSFQEMVAEFDGEDDEDGEDGPDYGMIGGDALVENALPLARQIWADRRAKPASGGMRV